MPDRVGGYYFEQNPQVPSGLLTKQTEIGCYSLFPVRLQGEACNLRPNSRHFAVGWAGVGLPNRKDVYGYAALFEGDDLVQNEGLREARPSLHDVGDRTLTIRFSHI